MHACQFLSIRIKEIGMRLKVMKERKVWDLVKAFEGGKPLGCRQVYTVKRNQKGDITIFKARLVVRDQKQERDETFNPIVNIVKLISSFLY